MHPFQQVGRILGEKQIRWWTLHRMRVNIQILYLTRVSEAKNEDHVGHVMKETDDKIVVFGENNKRFDIPKSEIYQVGMNVILKVDFPGLFKYEVPKEAPLPTGEPIETIDTDAFPEEYHGPK